MQNNRLVFIKPIGAIKASNGEYLAVYDAEALDELEAVGVAPSEPSQEELKKIYIEQENKKHMAAKKNFEIELDKPSSIVEEILTPTAPTPEEPQPKAQKQVLKAYTLNLEEHALDYLRAFAMVEKRPIKQLIADALEMYYKEHPEEGKKAEQFLEIWK